MRQFTVFAALGCAAVLLSTTPSFAQGRHRVTPEEKQTSDQNVQAALSQLQAAAGALQQGGGGQAITDLQSAESSLKAALPIYHDHREHSLHETDRAIRELERNTRRSDARAVETVNRAIAEAQAALQTN